LFWGLNSKDSTFRMILSYSTSIGLLMIKLFQIHHLDGVLDQDA
jgi:hypothetical protein